MVDTYVCRPQEQARRSREHTPDGRARDVIQAGGVVPSESKFQCYFRYHMSNWNIFEDLKAMLRSSAEYFVLS